jgi:hypothetical protein
MACENEWKTARSAGQNGDCRPPPYDGAVDVRIGVTYSPKEIDVELGDDADAAKLRTEIDGVLGGSEGVLWLTDRKGRQVGVPVAKVAYVEIGSPSDDRRIGFGGS